MLRWRGVVRALLMSAMGCRPHCGIDVLAGHRAEAAFGALIVRYPSGPSTASPDASSAGLWQSGSRIPPPFRAILSPWCQRRSTDVVGCEGSGDIGFFIWSPAGRDLASLRAYRLLPESSFRQMLSVRLGPTNIADHRMSSVRRSCSSSDIGSFGCALADVHRARQDAVGRTSVGRHHFHAEHVQLGLEQ